MLTWLRSHRRDLLAYSVVGAASVCAIVALRVLSHQEPPLFSRLVQQTPQLAGLATFSGDGYRLVAGGYRTDSGTTGRDIQSSAPKLATGIFSAHSGPEGGAGPRLDLSWLDANPVRGEVSDGVVAFSGALDGADVISVADSTRMELLLVVQEPSSFASPTLEVKPRDTDKSEVGADGGIVVKGTSGRALLALSRPVAVDATGMSRQGRFERVSDTAFRLVVPLHGMEPPVVIDPSVYVPHWTLLHDHSQPGARVFYEPRGSRQNRVAFDAGRGKVVLTRPARTQQHEDIAALMGNPIVDGSVTGETRTPGSGSGAKVLSAEERARWTSTHRLETETWELHGGTWNRILATGLPGYLDSSLTYLPATDSLFAFGGASPEGNCVYDRFQPFPTRCSNTSFDQGMVFELRGGTWVERNFVGAPTRRIRPAVGRFQDSLLVFGGRTLPDSYVVTDSAPPAPGRPNQYRYPDLQAWDLLADTYLFDGNVWRKATVQHPPRAVENAQIIFDERRGRAVMIGGQEANGRDWFSIHEFDGTDWVEVATQDSGTLPRDLQGRSDVSAFWHPTRRTTMFFGGNFTSLETCPVSDAEAADQLASDPTLHTDLEEAGCLGGYAHDMWEWNGVYLARLTEVAFAGHELGVPIFSQIGNQSWHTHVASESAATTEGPNGSATGRRLLAERFDSREKHFLLRSAHERAFERDPQQKSVGAMISGQVQPGQGDSTFRSPVFGSRLRMDAAFDTAAGDVVLVHPADGRIVRTNGESWSVSGGETPFSLGANDFAATTWDSVAKRIVLFEPQFARTWTHDNGAWAAVATGVVPPSVSTMPRVDDDLPHYNPAWVDGAWSPDQQPARTAMLARIPKMTFDHARNRAVMIYEGALWEFSGTQWFQSALPSALLDCDVATLVAYDPQRERTVVTGCRVPAQTWEWDGGSWVGPGPSPFVGQVQQWHGPHFALATPVNATVQLDWSHPDSLFYSPSQGGLAIMDNDGHLRVWDGAAWQQKARFFGAGLGASPAREIKHPWMGDKKSRAHDTQITLNAENIFYPRMSRPFGPISFRPLSTVVWINSYLPTAFYPPGFEDPSSGNIVIIRDLGSRGMKELRASDSYAQWHRVENGWDEIYPFPAAMLGAEHIHLKSWADPGTATNADTGEAYPEADGMHGKVSNLLWPFRIFVDYQTKRVRMMTNRGEIWEIGSETAGDNGDACSTTGDCVSGFCIDGVCCEDSCSDWSICTTCNGTNPGQCEPLPQGSPEPRGRCGSGDCAGVCGFGAIGNISCEFIAGTPCGDGASCDAGVFTPAASCEWHAAREDGLGPQVFGCVQPAPQETQSCGSGLGCEDESTCKTSCASRADCAGRFDDCEVGSGACVPDAVSVLASSMGIEPAGMMDDLRPTTPQELANRLREAGFPEQDGAIVHPSFSIDDHVLVFDPTLRSPVQGLQYCVRRILFCIEQGGQPDSCVTDVPRCSVEHPWQGNDPAGADCCPSECLTQYLSARGDGAGPTTALLQLVDSACYPGVHQR